MQAPCGQMRPHFYCSLEYIWTDYRPALAALKKVNDLIELYGVTYPLEVCAQKVPYQLNYDGLCQIPPDSKESRYIGSFQREREIEQFKFEK